MNSIKFAISFFLLLLVCALTAQTTTLDPGPAIANFTPKTPVRSVRPVEAFTAASFPGGHEALLRELGATLEYPELAREYAIEGMVVIRLTLDSSGLIRNRKVVRSLGFGCDEAALAALAEPTPLVSPGDEIGDESLNRQRNAIDAKLKAVSDALARLEQT
jgi:TonB family protein